MVDVLQGYYGGMGEMLARPRLEISDAQGGIGRPGDWEFDQNPGSWHLDRGEIEYRANLLWVKGLELL
jgi:hypothetical protein